MGTLWARGSDAGPGATLDGSWRTRCPAARSSSAMAIATARSPGVGERLDSPRLRTADLFGPKPHDVLVRAEWVPGHTSAAGRHGAPGYRSPRSAPAARSRSGARPRRPGARCQEQFACLDLVHTFVKSRLTFRTWIAHARFEDVRSVKAEVHGSGKSKVFEKSPQKWNICCRCDRFPLRPCNG